MEIYDRVCGEDSFILGVIYGSLKNKPHQKIVGYSAAHEVLAIGHVR